MNKVLESTHFLTLSPKFVFINHDKIDEVAERFSKEDLKIPTWSYGEHPNAIEKFEDVIDTFFLCNSINFAFTDFETGQKFESYHNSEKFTGSSGMWACVKHAIINGTPLLDANYLANFSEDDMEFVFSGNMEIPMINERLWVYGRFQNTNKHPLFSDVNESTVAADYVLPKGLRDMGILTYEKSLANKVDNGILIPADTLEELEIRASTIHACNEVVGLLNEKYGKNINAWHLDAKIWSEARKNKETKHHLTRTIAY